MIRHSPHSFQTLAGLLAAVLLVPAMAGGQDLAMAQEEANTIELVREYGPSVVAVHLMLADVHVHPGLDSGEYEGGGSGFVIDDAGRIITSFHVVAAALDEQAFEQNQLELGPEASLFVSFLEYPDREFPVRVHGANPDYDLALLEFVEPDERPAVTPLPLGNSDEVVPGQRAIAIGTPFGLHSTVTNGIVSAIARERPGLVGIGIPFIQTDAAINPGNSGGPLFDSAGKVIGINNAILAPAGRAFVGVGLAVPVDLLRESMDGLMDGGLSGVAAEVGELPERPRLGITAALSVDDYPAVLKEELDLPDHGVIVVETPTGGPADEAGLNEPTQVVVMAGRTFPIGGDIIVRAEGQDVRRTIELQKIVLEREAGDTVTLEVWHDGQIRSVDVTLEVVPVD